jgi:hypothetical protein
MAIHQLEKTKWRLYCDGMSKAAIGMRTEVEVASLRIGAQLEAKWLPLLGIVYDVENDIIEIALADLDHIVYTPRVMYIDDNPLRLSSMEIIDGDGLEHIIKFRDPLLLPLR